MTLVRAGCAALCKGWAAAEAAGNSESYDLSLADEVFAIFAGVTLFVSATELVSSWPRIIIVILTAVSVTVVALIVAINQARLSKRLTAYAVAIALGFFGVYWIMEESAHDLYPQLNSLRALPMGVIVWVLVREVSVFVLFAVDRRGARQANAADGPSGPPVIDDVSE